ncbi:MAG: CAP domain-containing protein [Candidatus Protochlamydia sp.]|nr:CAP domain-containing protein [Candidatus Protochlamydia sp.]
MKSFGENVAYSENYADPVKIAIDGWMKSQGHKENILGDFEESGIGVAISKDGKFYITQLFAKRKSS